MRFEDEFLRDEYHKLPTLTQVVASILEADFTRFGVQLELHKIEEPEGILLLRVLGKLGSSALQEIHVQFNKRFKRKDKQPTVEVLNMDPTWLVLYVTGPQDFEILT